jgi:hypothetical protein
MFQFNMAPDTRPRSTEGLVVDTPPPKSAALPMPTASPSVPVLTYCAATAKVTDSLLSGNKASPPLTRKIKDDSGTVEWLPGNACHRP